MFSHLLWYDPLKTWSTPAMIINHLAVDCAQENFRAAQLCPACETTLTEPDDVVICSLHPTNDYKTAQYDRVKRKALLNPAQSKNASTNSTEDNLAEIHGVPITHRIQGVGVTAANTGVSMGDVVNDMDANRIQRTPVRPVAGGFTNSQSHVGGQWHQQVQPQPLPRPPTFTSASQRRTRPPQSIINTRGAADHFDLTPGSDSEEVEEILGVSSRRPNYRPGNGGFLAGSGASGNMGPQTAIRGPSGSQQVLAVPTSRRAGTGFRPASFTTR
ncbi:hypothetical protein FRC03_001692 [Tulasnella sp. 419]|nr:hypothetical protein FRC03_001692 [Tulasnella sp. 419]